MRRTVLLLALVGLGVLLVSFAGVALAATIRCDRTECYGTSKNDTITGDGRAQGIVGRSGNDTINGLGRGDDLLGSLGNDVLRADGAGTTDEEVDYLNGEGGNDTLIGGDGPNGYSSDDTLEGEAGDDIMYGGSGPDIMYGGGGDDRIYGQEGAEWTDSDEEGDGGWIEGGNGDDTIYGGEGGDFFMRAGYGNDTMHGGPGADADMSGGPGDDTLYGDDGDEYGMYGGEGDDKLYGGPGIEYLSASGKDKVFGEEGEDVLRLYEGTPEAAGGPGEDEFDVGDVPAEDEGVATVRAVDGGADRILCSETKAELVRADPVDTFPEGSGACDTLIIVP